jgi:hypothetical protein
MILKNNDMRLIAIGDFRLLPGCNDVDSKLWKKYQEKYDLKEILNSKKLEEIKHKKGEKEVSFIDFPFSKKEDVVNNTYNVKTLQAWRKIETDPSIKVLIEDRLKGINDKTIKDIKNYGKPANHT